MVTSKEIPAVIRILKKEYLRFKTPYVTEVAAERVKDPFKVLISCILSLRTKDDVTRAASTRLFAIADTPLKLMALPIKSIEKAIYPAGFYKTKAVTIKEISKRLVEDYAGKVPNEIDELLKFKGVGRKTANLVVTMGFGKPGICVDTHVHRITNRWGFISTKTPDESETALRERLDRRYWIIINDLLVAYGQNLCKPVSPLCSVCRIYDICGRIGVATHR